MKRSIYLFIAILFLMGMLPEKPAAANDCLPSIVVTNTNDSGPGSLRQAVDYVCPGGEITFDESLSGGKITLEGHIWINKSLTITGLGADQLAISGGEVEHYIYEYEGDDVGGVFRLQGEYVGGTLEEINVNISGVTIRDGRAREGGGISNYSRSTLVMTDCVIGPNNKAQEAGGGISNKYGTLTLNRCTIWGNSQIGGGSEHNGGGGLFTINSPSLSTLINSTISGNSAVDFGGGILVWSGGRVDLVHSTVSGNTANEDIGEFPIGGGGGIHITHSTSTVQLHNSIVAGNTDMTTQSQHDPWPDVYGEFTSLGGNLIGDGTASTGWVAGDKVGTMAEPIDSLLDVLALNEPGTTLTMALLKGSPAINKAACVDGIDVDQRGVNRPQGFKCDIGAYELEMVLLNLYLPLIRR